MKRALAFAGRNLKELVRDPLSYIFCIGFPIVMLALMTVINESIPPEAGMDLFQIDKLAPGVSVFSLSFIMLFAALSVSKDRAGAFLTRLRTSPLRPFEFIIGYTLPLVIIAAAQFAVNYIAAGIIASATGVTLNIGSILFSCVVLLPAVVFFIAIGILFGTLLSDKAAPPCSSIIISLCGVMGGIWFDLAAIPGDSPLVVVCRVLPFSHATDVARAAISGTGDITTHLLVTLVWAVAVSALAVFTFKMKMKSEK